MTYQLLNENYVPARNLKKKTNIRNVIFFFKCLYLIYHLIGIQTNRITNCPTSQLFGKSSATSYPESPLIVWFKPYFHSQFKHTKDSARLLRRSNAYLFRKSTCTRSTLTKLPVSKLQRQSSIFISPSMFILTLQPLERKLPPVPWQPNV